MVQFNLLPDVKQQYIKAVYRRRLITLVCVVVGVAFLVIFVLTFLFVRVNQTRHLSHLDKDIKIGVAKLQSNKDLDKILTVQNQLASLPELHKQKVMTSRIFEYLGQVTPNEANVSNVKLDVVNKKINLTGSANSLQTVNKFVDTLKFTDYKLIGDEPKEGKAFSSVVLQSFVIGTPTAGLVNAEVAYEISFIYDEVIFMNTATEGSAVVNSVKLTVPKIITTRSETQKPAELFQSTPTPEGGSQ